MSLNVKISVFNGAASHFWAFDRSVSEVRAYSIFITAYFTLKKDRSKDYSVELYLYVCVYFF
jgi:hypothetical protein